MHEAWMRLTQAGEIEAQSRAAFHSVAAKAMRSVLVDHARRRAALKRERGQRVELSEVGAGAPQHGIDVIDLNDGLLRLAKLDAQLARVGELRLFGGLQHDEIGLVLNVSTRSSERAWRTARAWLLRELSLGE